MAKPAIPSLGFGAPNASKKGKPMIPSLGPNLGKLGFTDLTNDDDEKVEPAAQ